MSKTRQFFRVNIMVVEESKLLQTIILGSDWQEVLVNLITEEGMDPKEVDIIKLTDAFVTYLNRLKTFDFHIPARFVLIAAILLRMKVELLLEEEEAKIRERKEKEPKLKLEEIPELSAPLMRKATRKVTLNELVTALQKAFEFKERKEERGIRIRRAVVDFIEDEEDIELRIGRIFKEILRKGTLTFSDLVHTWKRKEIVEALLPMLYLSQRGKITCEQKEMFKEIYIQVV